MKKHFIHFLMYSLLCFIFIASNVYFCQARTLHLIMVIQEESVIGFTKDKDKIQRLAEDICVSTGMNINKYLFTKGELSSEKVVNELRTISCEKDDVIWFYYSGHGANGDGRWPFFSMRDNTAIIQKDLHERLKKKGARLTISMYESCNHGTGISHDRSLLEYFQYLSTYPLAISEEQQYVYKKLFLNAYGDVMICASKQGAYNLQIGIGGIFTTSFISCLNRMQDVEDIQNVNWKQLCENTIAQTQKVAQSLNKEQISGNCNPDNNGNCQQTPDAEINIWKEEPEELKPKRVIKFD